MKLHTFFFATLLPCKCDFASGLLETSQQFIMINNVGFSLPHFNEITSAHEMEPKEIQHLQIHFGKVITKYAKHFSTNLMN
jgi:hypothetical protein